GALGRSVAYRAAATFAFLLDPVSGEFCFARFDARLRFGHRAAEAVGGIDLVEWMIRLGAGDASPMRGHVHQPRGHAIEARLYAERPEHDFQPSSGCLTEVAFPDDAGVDAWVETGSEVSACSAALLAGLVVHCFDRDSA